MYTIYLEQLAILQHGGLLCVERSKTCSRPGSLVQLSGNIPPLVIILCDAPFDTFLLARLAFQPATYYCATIFPNFDGN